MYGNTKEKTNEKTEAVNSDFKKLSHSMYTMRMEKMNVKRALEKFTEEKIVLEKSREEANQCTAQSNASKLESELVLHSVEHKINLVRNSNKMVEVEIDALHEKHKAVVKNIDEVVYSRILMQDDYEDEMEKILTETKELTLNYGSLKRIDSTTAELNSLLTACEHRECSSSEGWADTKSRTDFLGSMYEKSKTCFEDEVETIRDEIAIVAKRRQPLALNRSPN